VVVVSFTLQCGSRGVVMCVQAHIMMYLCEKYRGGTDFLGCRYDVISESLLATTISVSNAAHRLMCSTEPFYWTKSICIYFL